MRYLVTGATGFVGIHVISRLLECGETVRALVRQPSAVEEMCKRGAEVWLGDLTRDIDWSEALESIDIVIHCAGAVGRGASSKDIWEVNVGGTSRLLAASANVGISRFVHLSSGSVYGQGYSPITEDAPKRPTGLYGRSKWAAEQAVWHYYAEHKLPIVILRPCTIYGQRDRQFLRIISRLFRRRLLPLPNGGRCIFDLVHISDLVDAVLAATTMSNAIGRAYNITDGEVHTYREILNSYGQIVGRRPVIVPIPGFVLTLGLQLVTRLMHVRYKSVIQPDRIGLLRILDMDLHYSIDAARNDLEYAPQIGLAEGLGNALTEEVGQQ